MPSDKNNNNEAANSKGLAKKAAYRGNPPCLSKVQLRP